MFVCKQEILSSVRRGFATAGDKAGFSVEFLRRENMSFQSCYLPDIVIPGNVGMLYILILIFVSASNGSSGSGNSTVCPSKS